MIHFRKTEYLLGGPINKGLSICLVGDGGVSFTLFIGRRLWYGRIRGNKIKPRMWLEAYDRLPYGGIK